MYAEHLDAQITQSKCVNLNYDDVSSLQEASVLNVKGRLVVSKIVFDINCKPYIEIVFH